MPTLVQSTTADSAGTQVPSLNVGPLTITAGNSISVHLCIRSGAPVSVTVTDSQSQGYTNDKTNLAGNAPSATSRHHNAAAGATTCTVACGANCAMELVMCEWAGLDPAGTVDQTGINASPANNTALSCATAGAVAQTAELVLGTFTTPFSNASYTQSGSYLIANHTPRLVVVYLTPAVTGVNTATVTIPSSQAWSGLIATYKAATGNAYSLAAAAGAYTYTGEPASLIWGPTAYTLLAAPGNYDYQGGQSAADHAINGQRGVYAYSGIAATGGLPSLGVTPYWPWIGRLGRY